MTKIKLLMKITEKDFLNYYEQGLKDSEIAKISGDCESVINKYRNSLNLPPNGRKVITDEEFFELYYKGYIDAEIAAITGCSSSQAKRRRDKYNLPVNKKKSILDNCFMELYNAGNNDLDIFRITGVSKSAVQNYRSKLGLPAIGKHSIDKDKLKQLFDDGKTDEEIAQILEKSEAHVAKTRLSMRLLRSEDKRPNNYIYNNEEFQVILGSILGDGSLVKKFVNGGTILKITHCERQKEYLKFKWNILKNNCSEIKKYAHHDSRRINPEYEDYCIYTKSSTSLNEVYNNWYRPTKMVYEPDLYKIEPLGLAIWYMDDGYKCKPYGGAMLCTNSFSKQELLVIQKMFKEKFNINVTLNCESDNLVYIPSEEFSKFRQLIEPYIIPCMKYKLE